MQNPAEQDARLHQTQRIHGGIEKGLTMIINDWATLDKLNKNHYGRGKPAMLLRCEETLQMAIEYNRIVETSESLDHVIALETMKSYLYDRWQIELGFNRHWSDDPRHYGEIEY